MRLYIFVLKIILAMIFAIVASYFIYPYIFGGLVDAKELSGLVVVVFVIGFVFTLIRILGVSAKSNWIDSYKRQNKITTASVAKTPKSLESIAKKLNLNGKKELTLEEYYNAVKSLDVIFSHNKDAGKWFVKLCFMVGFLGGFACIMMALGSISDLFTSMNLGVDETTEALSKIQKDLSHPLKSLQTSFAVSCLGIYLSCLLSYLDRQAFMAENKFLVYAENWLLSCTNQKNK